MMIEPTKTLVLALIVLASAWMPAGALAPAAENAVAHVEPLPGVPGWNADYLDSLDSTDFLGAEAQAVDSDKLDGLDSSAFALAGHTHAGPRLFWTSNNIARTVPAWPSCLLNYVSVSGDVSASGKLVVEADVRLETNHVAGTIDQVHLTPTDSVNDCSGQDAEASWIYHWVPAPMPTAVFKATLHTSRVFDVGAGEFTIYLHGHTDLGADSGDRIVAATLVATYYPS